MSSTPVIETYEDLGITRVSRWIWNCYVIHQGPVVVDAGLPCAASDISPIINDLGGKVHSVVASHGHSDHLAGAAGVAERFGATIYLPARSLPYLAGERARNPGPIDQSRIAAVFRDQPLDWSAARGLLKGTQCAGFGLTRRMRWQGPAPAGGLHDGDHLPGAPSWSVVTAPGHTDDSIAFWNSRSGVLLSGDAVLTRRGKAWLTPEVVDVGAAARTNLRLQELPVTLLLPGHGAPARGNDVWLATR